MANQLVCPLCTSAKLITFLTRFAVPVHQHLLYKTQQEAIQAERGDLILSVCEECGFVFNRAFEEAKLNYSSRYENTQLSSPYFQNYVDELVQHIVEIDNVRDKDIIEIGCGKGDFLRALVLEGNRGIGFDPSYIGPDSSLDGQLQFKKHFFDETFSNMKADVIVCRHVIEHIGAPVNFLQTIAATIQNKAKVRIFFETPDITWILSHQVVWDLFYEHCSYFTPASLATLFEMKGFSVASVSHVFNGQYIWLEATNLRPKQPEKQLAKPTDKIVELAHQYSISETQRLDFWRSTLHDLASVGRVAVWGAGAKGVTFVNLIDPIQTLVSCVVDLNPAKQGGYMPGSGHPIIHYEHLVDYSIDSVVVLNPNYYAEVEAVIRTENLPLTA